MTGSVFTELDHRLSVVKRWAILHTIQNQSVAEHMFNVARMAERISKQWFGMSDEASMRVVRFALHHDDFEALSGDLPTMVKPYFNESEFEREHSELIEAIEEEPWVVKIVKLADKLEGYHFLCIEAALGNTYSRNHLDAERPIILKYVSSTWPLDDTLFNAVANTMRDFRSSASTRHSKRGR